MVSARNILMTDLGPIGSLDSPVIKQIAQLNNPYSGVFSISRPSVEAAAMLDHTFLVCIGTTFLLSANGPISLSL